MASRTIPSWLLKVTCPLHFKSMLIEVSNQRSDLLVIPRCFRGWLGWCRHNNSCVLHAECSYCKYTCINATTMTVHWSYRQLLMASEIQSQTCPALSANSVVYNFTSNCYQQLASEQALRYMWKTPFEVCPVKKNVKGGLDFNVPD